jgi:YidC/Oxa1 family membrane protein insertase
VFDPLYHAVSAVMRGWHQLFGLLLGPSSGAAWALSVVLLVLTLRTILIRPFLAQVRAGRALRLLEPDLARLRRRHAGDPARLARESAALRKAHGAGPAAALLPGLLQVPIFLGLFHVLRSFTDAAVANYAFGADEVRSFLAARLFGAPLTGYLSMPGPLLDAVAADRVDVALVAVPLMLLAAVATHLSARHSLTRSTLDGPAGSLMRWAPWIFPLGVLAGALFFPFPIAILLFWLTQNVWTLAQQLIVTRAEPGLVRDPPPRPVPVARRTRRGRRTRRR